MGSDGNARNGSQPQPSPAETAAGIAGSTPGGNPARLGGYTPMERLVICLLVLAIAAALASISRFVYRTHYLPRKMMNQPGGAGFPISEPVGSLDAKVKVQVLMEHCLVPVQDLLVQLAKAYPDKVRAEFFSTYGKEGQEILAEHQESCAGVFVNGRNSFKIEQADGQMKGVYFHMNPGGSYGLADLLAAVKQEMEAVYGSAPPDFDERVSVEDVGAVPPVGSPGAGLVVEVLLSHPDKTLHDLLTRLGNACPDRLRVEFVGYSPSGGKQLPDDGEPLTPCLRLNGESRFTITENGTARDVELSGWPGGVYTIDDVVAVIRVEFVGLYGSVPSEFEQAVSPQDRPSPDVATDAESAAPTQ